MRIRLRQHTIAALAFSAANFLAPPAMAAPAIGIGDRTPQVFAGRSAGIANGSPNGFKVVLDMRDARLAMFKGDQDAAERLVLAARKALETASRDQNAATRAGVSSIPGGLIVVMGQLLFPPEPGGDPVGLAKVSKPMTHGPTDVGVSLVFSRLLMPVADTGNDLDLALRRLDDRQFAAANLALEAAEAGLSVDTVMLDQTTSGRSEK